MGTSKPAAELRERTVSVAILDDHGLLVDSLSSWFAENADDFEVVLKATSWPQFLGSELFPAQLVLMDYHLVEPVSIEARVLTCRAAGAKVIVMSAFGGPELEKRILQAGADAFFEKSTSMAHVLVAARELFRLPAISLGDSSWGASPSSSSQTVSEAFHISAADRPKLSSSEQEALVLYARGGSTKGVAAEMNVQYETAKTFLRRVREKYARAGRPASKRSELVRRAAEDGYLT
jgi:DNA-binding NarL/FixJ family response regulator